MSFVSININVQTPQKKEIANILRSVADMIEKSGNDTVTVKADIDFNKSKSKKEC